MMTFFHSLTKFMVVLPATYLELHLISEALLSSGIKMVSRSPSRIIKVRIDRPATLPRSGTSQVSDLESFLVTKSICSLRLSGERVAQGQVLARRS